MDKQLDTVMNRAVSERLPVSIAVEQLLESEVGALIERRVERRIKESKLPEPKLMSGLPDNTLDQKLKIYTRPDILLIDEVGFDRLEQESARNASLFFKVIDARYGKASTLVTTNVDFKELGDYLGDPVITTAIVDRLVHHSIIITIEGPSYRMHCSRQINRAQQSAP